MQIESTPVVHEDGRHIIVRWSNFQAECSHLDDVSGGMYGGLWCYCTWTCDLPGVDRHLHGARLNLTSTSAREGVAREIRRRVTGGDKNALLELQRFIDDFVEMACVTATQVYRKGRPLENLADHESDNVKYALGDFWPLMKRIQLYAPAEHIKTTFLLAGFMDLVTGEPTLGFPIAERMNAALIDWETDADDAANIWRRLAHGRGYSRPPDLFYLRAHRPLWLEAEALEPQLRARHIGVVGLDSAFWACGSNPLDQDKVGRMFQGIDELGELTTILLNHTAASQDDERRRRHYGVQHFKNACRASWEVRKAAQLPGDPFVHIGLFKDKLNMASPDVGPFGFKVRFEPNNGPIHIEAEPHGIEDTPELEESLPDRDRVLRYVRHHGKSTAQEIGEGTGIPVPRIYTAASRLKPHISTVRASGKVYYYAPADTIYQ